ncbi:MAG: leucine-rich repeat domain-containing protein, partial [Clostridiales bacterium]|nr:leucine-rich repeat domain-containing protein [Clostridiales bacterium]
ELTIDPENPKYKSDGNCLILKSDNTLLFANENSTIPSYVDKIAAYAFCSEKLESISISNGVKQILRFAFYCINLRHMEIPASVTDIETGAFGLSDNITEFVVADDNPVYKSDNGYIIRKSDNVLMFGCCGDIVLPDYITGIADYAFYGKKITQSALIIPKSVTWIGSICFEFCKSLEYVYLPNTLKELKTCSFVRETNGKGKYIGGVRSLTIPEGCVNDASTISYSAPECELGYDDGYPYVISYTYSARSIFSNNIPDRIFIYDETKDEIFGYPYRYGYTFGGFSATPNGSRITTPEEFQQTIFKEDGINKTKVYPIWIPNQTV